MIVLRGVLLDEGLLPARKEGGHVHSRPPPYVLHDGSHYQPSIQNLPGSRQKLRVILCSHPDDWKHLRRILGLRSGSVHQHLLPSANVGTLGNPRLRNLDGSLVPRIQSHQPAEQTRGTRTRNCMGNPERGPVANQTRTDACPITFEFSRTGFFYSSPENSAA